jgi:type IV pilus assembly protein PilA
MTEDNYQPPVADISPVPGGNEEEADLARFIGPRNTDYYLERFRQIADGKKTSWHWPAFFITSGWLLYRKMWLPALGYIIGLPLLAVVLMALLDTVVGVHAGALVYVPYYAFVFFNVPLFANRLYHGRAVASIAKADAKGLDAGRRGRLIENVGGTNLFAALALMLIPLTGIIAAITIPAYQDYTLRAQVSEGLVHAGGAKAAVTDFYAVEGVLPADNEEAGLEAPERLNGTYVESIEIDSGVVVIHYGNSASHLISGTALYLVPVPLDGELLEWSCDGEDFEQRWLPALCR